MGKITSAVASQSEYPQALSSQDVDHFKAAAEIVSRTLQKIVNECRPGNRVVDLCIGGDNAMREELGTAPAAQGVEKGIAFPTCVSINNCVSNYSPMPNDQLTLSIGDLVKIELGAHINGRIASVAHTHVVSPGPDMPLLGRGADVVCAAYLACKAAVDLCKPGVEAHTITRAIEAVADVYDCRPLIDVESCSLGQFVIDGDRTIPSKWDRESPPVNFELETFEVYNIDVAMSTGLGKPRAQDCKTCVYRHDINKFYQLKLKSARQLMAEVTKEYPVMAFALRDLGNSVKTSLGCTECVSSGLLLGYPVLFEKHGDLVARFKATVLLLPTGPVQLTGSPSLPYVHSDKNMPANMPGN